ncbi:MAG TPA: type IV secretion system DNA-binding domain-containing protein [bacterium]|nr:type IV secretion system DNA-binding domain-containing protein [bacterium]
MVKRFEWGYAYMVLVWEFSFFAVLAGAGILSLKRKALEAPEAEPQDPLGEFPLALTMRARPVITERARFQHLEIVGSSGTGKNYHGLLPMIHQDMARGAGLIIIDPKGAMRRTVAAYARACGRTRDLRCLDLADPEGSDTYNPFAGGDPALVAERAHAAFFSDDATATSFYRDRALSLFYPFFGLCRRLGVLATPEQLRGVAMDQGALAALVALAPGAPEARDLRRQALSLSPLEYSKNLQGVVNALTPLCTGAFASLLNTGSPGVRLEAVLSRGGILYAGLASDQYPSAFKRVSTLLLMDLQSSLTKRYAAEARPVFLYLDEFADLLYPQVRALVAKAREARVGIVLAHQSLGDLARQGRPIAEAIFENTANKILLRMGGADSAEMLARLSGSGIKAERPNWALRRGGLRGARTAQSLNAHQEKRPLFHPNDLMNLAVGEAFMIVQNSGGRELYRGRLRSAPEAGPFRKRRRRAKDRAPAPGPLDLAAPESADLRMPKPSTPLAKAALERMQRSRKHAL